jgi:hypothetical protein
VEIEDREENMPARSNSRDARKSERISFRGAHPIGDPSNASKMAEQHSRKKLLAKSSTTKKSAAKKPVLQKPVTQDPVVNQPPVAPPPKLMPLVGPFGNIILQNLKNAPAGTSDGALVMDTLRSLPADQLKSALSQSTAQERNQLFNAIPADQITSFISSLPVTVLAPAQPPPPTPAPVGGPPASILMTTYQNMVYPDAQNDPDWNQTLTGGKTIKDWSPFSSTVLEWTSVYDKRFEREGSLNNPMVGLTGWAVQGDKPISDHDVWFVHPFGNDFQFFIAPDPQYEMLLGDSNNGINPTNNNKDTEFFEATKVAQDGWTMPDGTVRKLGLEAKKGVLGVETDQGLVPQYFQDLITDGARVATFGRWIVDSGHNDFHTEIHAPLLMAVAKPTPPPVGVHGASEMTSLQIISRPYTVSQRFAEGNFVDHLLAEVANVETTIAGFPLSWRVEAHPHIFTTPYEGRPYIKLLVQPPPRKHGPLGNIVPQHLVVSYHFTHRVGVAVQVFDAGNGTVGIIIVLGDLNPANLPTKHDQTVPWDKLGSDYSWIIDGLQIADILTLDIASAVILNRGILTDLYEPPSPSSPLDNQNVASAVSIDQLQPGAGLSEDDLQPFPIYGWLNVWWQENQPIVH